MPASRSESGQLELRHDAIERGASQAARTVDRRVLMIGLLMLLVATAGIGVWMQSTWRAMRTELQERMLTALAEAAAPVALLFSEVERSLTDLATKRSPSAGSGGLWLLMPNGRGAILDPSGRPIDKVEDLALPPAVELLGLIKEARESGQPRVSLPFQVGYDWYATAVRPHSVDPRYSAAVTFSINAMLAAWQSRNPSSEASFALLTRDGRVWLRQPFAAQLVGADASHGPLFRAMREAGTATGIAAISQGDEQDSGERMVAWRTLQLFGLAIAAGQDMDNVTLVWRDRYLWLFIGAGLVAVSAVGAVLLFGRALGREAARREAAMLQVEASEERFRDMADAASDWFWESDEMGRFAYVSDRVRDASGLDPTWFKGRSFAELIDLEHDREHAELFLGDLEDRRPFREYIFRMDLGRGRFRWIKASGKPLFDEDEVFLGYRGTASDITLAREAESRAAAAQLRLLRAVESVSEAFALFNRNDRLIMCNERFRALHLPGDEAKIQPGLTYEEFLNLIGRTGQVSLDGLSLEAWVARRLRLRALGEAAEQRMADGAWFSVVDHRTPEGDCIAVFTDITQFKQREAQLITLATREGRKGEAG